MRIRLALVLALALSACGGAADHQGDESLQATLRLSPTPPMVGEAGVGVQVTDGGIGLLPPAEVTVAVHGASGPPESLRFEGGSWVGILDFPSPGDVRVDVKITTPDGRTATLGLPVRVVRRP